MSTTKFEPKTLSVFASLRFTGDRLEPEQISRLLWARPTVAYRKGEVFKQVRGHDVRGRTGLWLISSEGQVHIADLNGHLEYLLGLVFSDESGNRLHSLETMMKEDGIKADVPCFWYGERGAQPPVIRDDIRARFALIPAKIDEDFDTD